MGHDETMATRTEGGALSGSCSRLASWRLAGLVGVVALGLGFTACTPPPGEAAVTFHDGIVGRAWGPATACHGAGHYGDELRSWEWSGTVGGRPTKIAVIDEGIAFVNVDIGSEAWSREIFPIDPSNFP